MAEQTTTLPKKTAEDFRQSILNNKIESWFFRECSLCGCPIGYLFKNDQVGFDGNCDCSSYSGVQLRSYQDLADHYNMQSSAEYLKKIDDFFKFNQ